jgi:hypothetical protein
MTTPTRTMSAERLADELEMLDRENLAEALEMFEDAEDECMFG